MYAHIGWRSGHENIARGRVQQGDASQTDVSRARRSMSGANGALQTPISGLPEIGA
jgi:hypothetical protein